MYGLKESPNKIYYSLKEISEELGTPISQLRYWEKYFKINSIQSQKNGTKRYTKKEVELFRQIAYLSKEEQLTLDGIKSQIQKDQSAPLVKQTLLEIREFLDILRNSI